MAKFTRTVPNPITEAEHAEIQEFLMKHGLCIKGATKNIRVYRFKGWRKNKMLTSRDFVYVINADDYRADKKKICDEILAYSKKCFDKMGSIDNKTYEQRMREIEEDLLINHSIRMNWIHSKTVKFDKIYHVCKDKKALEVMEKYVDLKNKAFTTRTLRKSNSERAKRLYRTIVNILNIVDENIEYVYWKDFQYVTKNGKVVALYSIRDNASIYKTTFERGIKDKFDFNMNIMDKKYIDGIIEKAKNL